MIGSQNDVVAKKVVAEMLKGRNNCEQFASGRTIIALSRVH